MIYAPQEKLQNTHRQGKNEGGNKWSAAICAVLLAGEITVMAGCAPYGSQQIIELPTDTPGPTQTPIPTEPPPITLDSTLVDGDVTAYFDIYNRHWVYQVRPKGIDGRYTLNLYLKVADNEAGLVVDNVRVAYDPGYRDSGINGLVFIQSGFIGEVDPRGDISEESYYYILVYDPEEENYYEGVVTLEQPTEP